MKTLILTILSISFFFSINLTSQASNNLEDDLTTCLTNKNSIPHSCDSIEFKTHKTKVKVYTSLKKALRHPEKVIALDLSGQDLNELSSEISKLKNLEFLWLNAKLRNLWFYPKAWPYKFFGKSLPAGGYAHIQGRGGGKFYYHNNLKELPKEIFELKFLKVLDLSDNTIKPYDYLQKLKENNPNIIVLSYEYKSWETIELELFRYRGMLKDYNFK